MTNEPSQSERQVRVLLAIAEAMSATLDRQTLLEQMLAAIVTELGYKGGVVRLLDVERGSLELAGSYGLSAEYLQKGPVDLEHSGVDRMVCAGKTVVIEDTASDPNVQYAAAAQREGLRAALALPLQRGSMVVGVLRVYTAELHEFSTEEREFLSGVANLAARAVANAVLYQSFRAVADEVNSTLEVREVLRRLLATLRSELNVKAGSVRLVGPTRKRLHVAAADGLSEEYLAKGDVRIAESPIDTQVLQEGRPVFVYDVASEQGFQYPDAAAREGIRSVLAVPLQVRDTIVGVLRVYSGQPHRFTHEEIALVEAIADLGALALDNAHMHEELSQKYEAARDDWAGWFRYLTFS